MYGFDRRSGTFLFLNLGHAYDHLFMLLFTTVVLGLEHEPGFEDSYGGLLALSITGFIAFGAGSLPAGWLGDRWSRPGMMIVFFIGIGASSTWTATSARHTASKRARPTMDTSNAPATIPFSCSTSSAIWNGVP